MDKKYIDKFIDTKFFEFPKGYLKSLYYSLRMNYSKTSFEQLNPCLILCNKSCGLEDFLLRRTISTDYVVLKDSVISQIYNHTLSAKDKKLLLADIKILKDAMISIVVFPEKQISIFGKSQTLPEEITEFLVETKLNIKFLNFANSYFAKPIWSPKFRQTNVFLSSKFNLTHNLLSSLSVDERNSKINKAMPSSASIYGHKSHILIRSNKLAEGLESIVFACPNCHEFFSLKSELNHLKCHNCNIPFECTNSGEIYTNGQTISFDELDSFLHEILKTKNFPKNEVATYQNISFGVYIEDRLIHSIENLTLDIFVNRLKIKGIGFEKQIDFKDIINFEYLPNNTLKFTLNTTEIFSIKSNVFDNIYIIYALINNKKSQH